MKPVSYRNNIPFFYNKTPSEFRQDDYERYSEMVVRQSALHLADTLWSRYSFQPVLDFAAPFCPTNPMEHVVEIGCGVGRWIAEVARDNPKSHCWGIDYSYQMLKRAQEYWIQNKSITID